MYNNTANEMVAKKIPSLGLVRDKTPSPLGKMKADELWKYFKIPEDKRDHFILALEFQLYHAYEQGKMDGRHEIQKGIRELLDVSGKFDDI